MHPRITHAVNTPLKGLALFAGTIFALFAAYMLWWRVNFCTMMMQWNAAIPPRDLDNYMMRRLAQREVCGFGDYTSLYVGMFIGVITAGLAWPLRSSSDWRSAAKPGAMPRNPTPRVCYYNPRRSLSSDC